MTAAGMTAAAIKGCLKQQGGAREGPGSLVAKACGCEIDSVSSRLEYVRERVACGCVSLPWLTHCALVAFS